MGRVVQFNTMMIPDRIVLRPLSVDDLQKVAEIHRKAFKDSALTKLGLEPVRRYYEWQLTGPHDCFAVGAFEPDDSLIGFCFAGAFKGSLSGFLQKNKKFLVSWLLTHPWLIFNSMVVERIKTVFPLKRKKSKVTNEPIAHIKSFGILSIAVDPEKQRSGIGKMIMQMVEKEAKERGYRRMNLTVHPSNKDAVAFYEKWGWEKSTGRDEWVGSMYKDI
jgi:ribosomal protein S18 acetylase RimI-like enzyme